jgi:hypothetical protein
MLFVFDVSAYPPCCLSASSSNLLSVRVPGNPSYQRQRQVSELPVRRMIVARRGVLGRDADHRHG